MNCHRCHRKINITEQIQFANEQFYEDVEPPIVLMIDCANCDAQTMMLEFIPMDEEDFEEIDSPALGEKVKAPKL